jgi:hypothetical protein
VRKEKRECWQKFLEGLIEILEDNSRLEDTNRCWTVLRYTLARLGFNTPAIKAVNETIAITIEEKEVVFLKSAFPGPIEGLTENPPISIQPISNNIAIRDIDIKEALFNQFTKKALRPDRLNFKALRLLWQWDKDKVKALVTQCFRQGHHLYSWRIAKGIILKKPNKPDSSVVKAYKVISLLNCLGKVVEKVAATALSRLCEEKELLYPG